MSRTSIFASDFIAAKADTEMIQAQQYNCFIMGIPIIGPTKMFYDNEAVIRNPTMPDSTSSASMLLFGVTIYKSQFCGI